MSPRAAYLLGALIGLLLGMLLALHVLSQVKYCNAHWPQPGGLILTPPPDGTPFYA